VLEVNFQIFESGIFIRYGGSNKWMILPCLSNRFLIPDRVNDIHTWAGIGQAIAFAFEDILVASCMQVGEK
jgi:hypothetical protein